MNWPSKKMRRTGGAAGALPNNFNQPAHYIPITAPVDTVLARLDRVKPVGKDRWRAQCPVHDGHSLQVTEADDGKVLLRCWGCDAPAAEICRAIGLELRDLFPHDPWRPSPGLPRTPRMSAEMREQLALDRWTVHIFLADSAARRPMITDVDVQLAAAAIARLHKYDPAFFERAQYVYGGAKA